MVSHGETADPVLLATAGYEHTIRFWHANNGVCYKTLQFPDSQVNDMAITPDRNFLAAAGYQHIRMYDINSSNTNPLVNYDGVSKNVTALGFQEDNKWMFTGGEDLTARIWDVRSRNLSCQRMFQVNAPVTCVYLHPNQSEIFVGDQSGIIHKWDLKTDQNEQLIPEPDCAILSIAVDDEGTHLAAANNKGSCYIWYLTGGRGDEATQMHPKTIIPAHKRFVLRCRFSPDATLLATSSADMTIHIYRTTDFSLMTTLQDPMQRWVWDFDFSADSQYLISASSDNVARLWNIDSGEVIREYAGHQKAIVSMAFKDTALSD